MCWLHCSPCIYTWCMLCVITKMMKKRIFFHIRKSSALVQIYHAPFIVRQTRCTDLPHFPPTPIPVTLFGCASNLLGWYILSFGLFLLVREQKEHDSGLVAIKRFFSKVKISMQTREQSIRFNWNELEKSRDLVIDVGKMRPGLKIMRSTCE